MKFKMGDKVRVRDGFCCPINREILTIRGVEFGTNNEMPLYLFKENNHIIAESMLDYVNPSAFLGNSTMPEIIDYKYNSETGETYIKWADKTETRVKPENGTEPNQFVGFVTAYAKKAAGNTSRINSLFDKWAIKKPVKDKKAEEKRIADEIEEKRIIEKRKAKREKWLIRREALRIKREYEARKIAHEKYGVSMDDKPKKKKGDKK